MLLLIILSFVNFKGGTTLDVTSSVGENGTVFVCQGDSVTFPWAVSSGSDHISEVQWFFHGHGSEQLVAMFAAGNFIAMPTFSGRVTNVAREGAGQGDDMAGLLMTNITPSDAGTYFVEVHGFNDTGASLQQRSTLQLVVQTISEAPTAQGERLQVTMSPVAAKDGAGETHIVLTCGTLQEMGQPPVSLEWVTASGASVPGTARASGSQSTLLVPNPVPLTGAFFSCRVPPDSPAAMCLPPGSPVLREANMSVDATLARLILLEAQNQDLQASLAALQAKDNAQQASLAALQAKDNAQQASLAALQANESSLQAENQDLREKLQQEELSANQTRLTLENQIHQLQSKDRDIEELLGLRLVGGSSRYEGRVELLYDGQWGTVCDDVWDSTDAGVVCAMLGYSRSGATAYTNAHFGQGTGRIWLDDVQCTGSEHRLLDCPHYGTVGSNICGHYEDAGVSCQP